MGWQVFLVVAALLVFIVVVLNVARRRRPERFRHDGQTYQRRSDGTFLTDSGLPVTGAATVGALAASYQEQCGSSASHGAGGDGCSGDGGGDGGGGGGGE